jgi:hypothetical protein
MGLSPFSKGCDTVNPDACASGRSQRFLAVLEVEISFPLDAGIARRCWYGLSRRFSRTSARGVWYPVRFVGQRALLFHGACGAAVHQPAICHDSGVTF